MMPGLEEEREERATRRINSSVHPAKKRKHTGARGESGGSCTKGVRLATRKDADDDGVRAKGRSRSGGAARPPRVFRSTHDDRIPDIRHQISTSTTVLLVVDYPTMSWRGPCDRHRDECARDAKMAAYVTTTIHCVPRGSTGTTCATAVDDKHDEMDGYDCHDRSESGKEG